MADQKRPDLNRRQKEVIEAMNNSGQKNQNPFAPSLPNPAKFQMTAQDIINNQQGLNRANAVLDQYQKADALKRAAMANPQQQQIQRPNMSDQDLDALASQFDEDPKLQAKKQLLQKLSGY